MTDTVDVNRSAALKARLTGIVRTVARRTIPVPVRRKAWELFVGRYFDRSSIREIVTRAKASERAQPAAVQKLIRILEENNYRPVYGLIRAELGLDFKGFSCQDLIAYIHFNGRPDGFFIDIGAFDGVEISNSYALEQLGWQGVCIEPIPEIYSLLIQNRNCHSYNVAVSSASTSGAGFLKVSRLLGLSGLQTQMPDRIRKGLERQGLEIEQISVETVTFDDLMKNHPGLDWIDFLSIDVEGGELEVLNTIDFTRYRFGLITIENNAGGTVLRDFMRQRGYAIFMDLGVDLMFAPID